MTETPDKIIRAGIIQLELPPGDVAGNREVFRETLHALDDVDLVVAPELFIAGYDLELISTRGDELSEPLDGPTAAIAREAASLRGFTVVVGIIERSVSGQLYDTAIIVTPEGAVTPYRKSHLFPTEIEHFAAGNELFVIDTPAGRLGPQICFEHAFPAISTTLAMAGAQILVIPSAVGAGYEHLLTLRSRARAQDNQVFVVAANLNSNGFCGHSLIADPAGNVLAAAEHDDAILYAELNLGKIAAERVQEQSLSLARPELYRQAAVTSSTDSKK